MYKFILLFISINLSCFSQSYSVKTVFKGDTVVILSSEKVDEINEVFTTQKQRIEDLKYQLSLLDNSIDSLNKQFESKNKVIDSLNTLLLQKKNNADSIQNRLNITEKWILESSINSCYMYYSWPDSAVRIIDTKIFMFVGHRRSGNFSLVRMADNKYENEFIRKNWSEKEYPPVNWELNYKDKVRPKILSYPFKINF